MHVDNYLEPLTVNPLVPCGTTSSGTISSGTISSATNDDVLQLHLIYSIEKLLFPAPC